MTGTDKKKSIDDWKFKKPGCFKNFNVEKYIDYRHSERLWMTSKISNEWLLSWDRDLQKKILVVVDRCPSHEIYSNLVSIELLYLPAKTTTILQPMDQGIIRSFKANFNKIKFDAMLEKIVNETDPVDSHKKLNLKDGLCLRILDGIWMEKCYSEIIRSETGVQ
ncbi:tigger transposable element-derived protein 6-like [Octopus sinensis]|uniref:Tigger transposable element-derived protein 6-like n=1 Tax=Octopus sinensis TaxID=2607531 RepID=A0A6P7TNZ0_9MOLL|nr:tigger transposable element-derived protein 6-like [Octopus sinensis]